MNISDRIKKTADDKEIFDILTFFLENKTDPKILEDRNVKKLIDSDKRIWNIWNKVRWTKALSSRGVDELKRYFGKEFVEMFDSSWALADEWYSTARDSKANVEKFYTSTKNYIYNSVVFYESGDRKDLRAIMKEIVTKYKIRSVMDYGCSVGNDGLNFIEMFGIHVTFVDFDSPSLDFLDWRLKDRNISSKMYDILPIGTSQKPSAELLWAVDVIEHMLNPFELLDHIGEYTKVVAFFVDDDDDAGGRHPFHFKVNYSQLDLKLKELGFNMSTIDGMLVYSKM